MSRKQAYVNFYASNCHKIHKMHDSDIFQLKIKIPDKKILFATLRLNNPTGYSLYSLSVFNLKESPCISKVSMLEKNHLVPL